MPFTFSHPAIILPFKYLSARWISMTGLVIGSVTPDFEYFIRMRIKSIYSHTLPGLFWFDIPLGLGLTILYLSAVKDPLVFHLPKILKVRFQPFITKPKVYSIKYIAVICLSVFIGAASHIFWDGFTHPTGIFIAKIPQLANRILLVGHWVYVYKLMQHGSTVLGGLIVLLTIYFLPQGKDTKGSNLLPFWLWVGAIIIGVMVIRIWSTPAFNQLGNLIAAFISAGLIGLLFASIIVRFKPQLF